MSDITAEEMEKAEEALSDARVLRTHDGSRNATAGRLYYASYHAAKAVLYAKGYQPKTHAGVVSLFGEHIVKEGEATESDRRFLARAQTRREQADYGYEPLQENIGELFVQTKEFIIKMDNLI